jgi:flagellar hook-length control protein FliK
VIGVKVGAQAAGLRADRMGAGAPTSLPADGASPRSATTDGSARAAADARASRAADRSTSASPDRAGLASNASHRDAVSVDTERAADAPGDFAAVLAASNPADASAASPSPSTAAATTQVDATVPAATESPDGLLALLSGSWAPSPVGAGGAAAHAAPGAGAGDLSAVMRAAMTPEAAAALPSPLPTTAAAPQADDTAPAATESGARMLAPPSGSWALPAAAVGGADAMVEPGAGAGASPASLRAPMTAAAGLPLAAASSNGEPAAALAALAAGGIAAAGRDAARPGDDGAAPVDAVRADSFTVTATTPATAVLRAASPALPPTASLALPADPDAGFDDGFGTRLAWMAEQRLGHAQIRLNPEHLGPLEIRVQLDGDRLNAQFGSIHAEVRQAIEASLPRLRDMLGQHGLQLGQADVGHGHGHGQSGRREGDPRFGGGHDPTREAELDPRLATMPIRAARGLLDEYA